MRVKVSRWATHTFTRSNKKTAVLSFQVAPFGSSARNGF